jgi:hypothetical protein
VADLDVDFRIVGLPKNAAVPAALYVLYRFPDQTPIRIEGFCATRLLTAGLTSSLGVIFLSRGKPLRHSVNAAGDGTAIAFFGRRDTAPTRSN